MSNPTRNGMAKSRERGRSGNPRGKPLDTLARAQRGITKENKPAHNAADESKRAARCALETEINACAIIETFGRGVYGDTSTQETYERLRDLTAKGDTLAASERMLLSQAHALDVMFANLGRRAASNIGRNMLSVMEAYMRLALRAQNQCRMTLETLATIKNPPVVFAKQANIAHGHQQVNNGEAVPVARAGDKGNRPNELSRIGHGEGQSLDRGTLQGSIGSRAEMEAVAAVNRPKDRKG